VVEFLREKKAKKKAGNSVASKRGE